LTDAGFELLLILDDTFQLGWDRVDEITNAGDGAAGEKYHEAGDGFLLDSPPKASV
jgi:hypothetical protein